MKFQSALRRTLITAQAEEPNARLRVLVDEVSHRMAQKIFKTFIGGNDYSQFHGFMQDLDRLLAKYGGRAQKSNNGQNDNNSQNNQNNSNKNNPPKPKKDPTEQKAGSTV